MGGTKAGGAGRTSRMYAPRVGKATENKNYKFVDIFEPLEWQLAPLKSKAPVILLTGSAGGGKSMCAAQKVHAFCLAYKGATAVVVRKTKTSMYNSTVAFLKEEVMGRYLKTGRIKHLSTEARFEYDNGSVLVYGGMASDEQREAIRGVGQKGGVDIVWMEEAHQFEEQDFDELKARMRGNAAGWRQLIVTTNPDSPMHWIRQRLILGGEAKVFYSRAAWNYHNPNDYESLQLNSLRGVERDRLRDGKWTQAGGLVLDSFSDEWGNDELNPVDQALSNVTPLADYVPGGGPVVWWVDDGYSGERDPVTGTLKAGSHPRVFMFVQLRNDGRIAIFNESYEIKMLAPEHIKKMISVTEENRWPKPSRVIYDRAAASLGGHLKDELGTAWKIPPSLIVYNTVPVDQGNKEVNTRLAPDENGVRQIIVHPRCVQFRTEAVTYRINEKTGRVVKDFDHGPDAMRIGVWDFVHGGPAEVDVATIDTVTLPSISEESAYPAHELEDGIVEYRAGDVTIAVLV